MKWIALTVLTFICLACGGMLPERTVAGKTVTPAESHIEVDPQHRIHLGILEAKYLKEDRSINLAIVRGMILELEEKHPKISLPDSLPDLKEMRKRPDFMALELTIEHLSHRESVKQNTRHSAYHDSLP